MQVMAQELVSRCSTVQVILVTSLPHAKRQGAVELGPISSLCAILKPSYRPITKINIKGYLFYKSAQFRRLYYESPIYLYLNAPHKPIHLKLLLL